jgi:putative ABC transport system substrate-binding protein
VIGLTILEDSTMQARALRLLVMLALGLLIAPGATAAPVAHKVSKVGVLVFDSPPAAPDWKQRSVFVQALRQLGWREGENLIVEYRWAPPQLEHSGAFLIPPADDLAAELVRLPVDVIVANSRHLIRAIQHASPTIPIVMIAGDDPVAEGFIAGLARPGGHITGVDTSISAELSTKQLEFLKEAVPAVTRMAVLVTPFVPATGQILDELKGAAQALGVQLQVVAVYHPREIAGALDAATREGAGALLVLSSLLLAAHQSRLLALVAQHRLPAIYGSRSWVTAGGLLAYGPHAAALWQRAAYYVDRLLKGAKPADLPVERPARFEFIINLKTAQALGLTIPPTLLFQADEVIR